MATATPKRRRKGIPYIGEPPTASEIAANYPLTPRMQKIVDRALARLWEKRDRAARRSKRATPAKTARTK